MNKELEDKYFKLKVKSTNQEKYDYLTRKLEEFVYSNKNEFYSFILIPGSFNEGCNLRVYLKNDRLILNNISELGYNGQFACELRCFKDLKTEVFTFYKKIKESNGEKESNRINDEKIEENNCKIDENKKVNENTKQNNEHHTNILYEKNNINKLENKSNNINGQNQENKNDEKCEFKKMDVKGNVNIEFKDESGFVNKHSEITSDLLKNQQNLSYLFNKNDVTNIKNALRIDEILLKKNFKLTKRNMSNFKKCFADIKYLILSIETPSIKEEILSVFPYGSVTQCTQNIESDIELTLITRHFNMDDDIKKDCSNEVKNSSYGIELLEGIYNYIKNKIERALTVI